MTTANQSDNPVLTDALEYHRRGWCVIPVPVGSKKARIKWKQYQHQRPDEAQLRRWFASGKNNVALICGPVSGGLTVIDFDDAGLYKAWVTEHPELAETLPTVQTGRGYHVYFRSDITKTKPLKGIDIKASGYVLAPPSKHPSGDVYQWIVPLNGSLQSVDLSVFKSNLTQEAHEPQETQETQETQVTQETQETHSSKGGVVDEVILLVTGLCRSGIVKEVVRAIVDTLPEKIGQRNKRIFLLAQRLQSIPEYTKSKPEALKEIVRVWHKLALPTISTKPFELTWIDFKAGWPKVKHLRLSGKLGDAIRKAKAELESGQGLACEYESYEVRLLLQTCYELRRDDGLFEMGCRTAGEVVMGQSRQTGNNVMPVLEDDGWVKTIKKGRSRIIEVKGKDGKKKKKMEYLATEYRWIKKLKNF